MTLSAQAVETFSHLGLPSCLAPKSKTYPDFHSELH